MKKLVREDMMGGVGAPMATPYTTPGMGSAVPASNSGIGSGDKWGNVNKKPYTQSNKPKLKTTIRKKKKVKKLEEENINPYDKIGTAMAKKMGVKQPFKKKKEKRNQSAMVQKKFEHKIDTFETFINEYNKFERNLEPKQAMGTGGLQEFVDEFKEIWNSQYSYIGYNPTDKEIIDFISQPYIKNIKQAADLFSDYVLSQGLSDDVMESVKERRKKYFVTDKESDRILKQLMKELNIHTVADINSDKMDTLIRRYELAQNEMRDAIASENKRLQFAHETGKIRDEFIGNAF